MQHGRQGRLHPAGGEARMIRRLGWWRRRAGWTAWGAVGAGRAVPGLAAGQTTATMASTPSPTASATPVPTPTGAPQSARPEDGSAPQEEAEPQAESESSDG